MMVRVNGTEHELPGGARLGEAIAASGAAESRRGVAVAVDGEVVPRSEWDATELREGMHVEVLQAVQGG
ncbi:MAG: sulfur carrier protein [Thermoleophilaceae bacterium]|jgi:sulfur carrier protein|nr:sulfur carrier protein [Thermoleophilaceae bacterium]